MKSPWFWDSKSSWIGSHSNKYLFLVASSCVHEQYPSYRVAYGGSIPVSCLPNQTAIWIWKYSLMEHQQHIQYLAVTLTLFFLMLNLQHYMFPSMAGAWKILFDFVFNESDYVQCSASASHLSLHHSKLGVGVKTQDESFSTIVMKV